MASAPSTPDLHALLDSWEVGLRAARKSPQTVKSYITGVRQYLDYCAEYKRPATLDRRTLDLFVDHLVANGAQPATAVSRQLGVDGSPRGSSRRANWPPTRCWA